MPANILAKTLSNLFDFMDKHYLVAGAVDNHQGLWAILLVRGYKSFCSLFHFFFRHFVLGLALQ
ncbi:MAG: hypothetical protein KGY69_12850, partial [Bacteroidales bacterium]|nr:hypothetical protein [Bacteroidales bacterium]